VIFPDDIINQHGDLEHQVIYQSPRFKDIQLSLADPEGEDSRRLFSHFLWNAGLQLAEFIEEEGDWNVRGSNVIELGAGTGLAGIVACLSGASKVVITDYPAPEVLANIKANIKRNLPESARIAVDPGASAQCYAEGHEWAKLEPGDEFATSHKGYFDYVLAADCLWMPWEHQNLMKSISWFLSHDGRAWIIAGFHTGRPKMAGFFDEEQLAQEGLEVEKIWERDAEGHEREWVTDRGVEDITRRKRWLVIAILKKKTNKFQND